MKLPAIAPSGAVAISRNIAGDAQVIEYFKAMDLQPELIDTGDTELGEQIVLCLNPISKPTDKEPSDGTEWRAAEEIK